MESTSLHTNFKQISDLLRSENIYVTPSELQGMLSGFLCGGLKKMNAEAYALLSDFIADGYGLGEKVRLLAQQLSQDVLQQLQNQESPQLLLPSYTEALNIRLEALSDWIQSFLAGFAAMAPDLEKASTDVQELLEDFTKISQVSNEFEAQDEESEAAFDLLCEHIALGTRLFFKAFNPLPEKTPSSSSTQKLH